MIHIAINGTRLSLLMVLAFALAVSAASLTPDPDFIPVTGGICNQSSGERDDLVNDGSFEDGTCGAGSAWTCYTDTACEYIVDPSSAWGYPAYDGILAAWLGGYCSGSPNTNSFCQDIYFDARYLDWYWMGYVNDECGAMEVRIDGSLVFEHPMVMADHTLGTWNSASGTLAGADGVDVHDYFDGTHELCFAWSRGSCGVGDNDNMLIDYVTLHGAVGVETATVYPDGSGDYPNIQAAINAIAPGGTVFLADGNFWGPGNFQLDFLGKDFELRSLALNPYLCRITGPVLARTPAGPGSQMGIDSRRASPENGDRLPEDVAIYFESGEGPDALVRGITFKYAYNPNDYGGAIHIEEAAPTIQNCVFETNFSIYGGGAIGAINGSPTILDCAFRGNGATWGGAIEITGPGSVANIEDCEFVGNFSADDGGAINIYEGANVSILNCVFLDNTSIRGGAISIYPFIYTPYADIRYCTFSENAADWGGVFWATVPFRSWFNILSYSEAGGAMLWTGGDEILDFACTDIFGNVEGDWTGILALLLGTDGNISEDPQYCGMLGTGNLKLQSDSPGLPGNNDCGQQLGAFGQGCGNSAALSTSWSRLKTIY